MKFLKNFFKRFKLKSYEEKRDEYLSQATSREHFEYLEREWFKSYHVNYNPYYLLAKGVVRSDKY